MSDTKIKLGSLFSGIGGFELVGSWYNIEPVWASEIEPAPIRITSRHFPNMKHLGDITKIKGYEVEPVDVITGGSPCQDMSVAGKQEGIKLKCESCGTLVSFKDFGETKKCPECGAELESTRSGLFMEQMRIIREMREKTDKQYPKVAVWENVCFEGNTLVTCEDGYKKIKNVHIGEKVKTLSGKYLPVVKCHKTKYQKVVRLSVSGSEDIIVTENHPFYAVEKSYDSQGIRYFSKPEWITVKELTTNHMVGYRLDIPELPDTFITETEAWTLGRWLADGCVDTNRSTPRIFISVGESKLESAREMLNRLPYEIHENRVHKSAVNFVFTSNEFYNLIIDAGRGAANKHVPAFVFKLPYNLQKAVLDGYISGDGYIRNRNNNIELSACTVSRELAYGISRLIRNCCHVGANISISPAKDGMIDGRIIKANHEVFRITASITSTASINYFDGIILWQPVKNIEKIKKTETVYNLSVLEDNTYEANSIICHNCGALGSNNGEDFFCVIREFCKLMGERISSFRPEKWTNAGEILGESCSIAWRVLDAQYWGVPQRRRRIFLVTDFTGQRAGEILFKSEGLRRHTPSCKVPWKRFTAKTEKSVGTASADNQNGLEPICVATQQANAEIMFDKCPTLTEANGTSGSNKPYVVLDNKMNTYDINSTIEEPVYCIQGNCIDRADTAGCNGKGWKEDVSFTLTTVDRPAVAYGVSENMNSFDDKSTKSTESDEKPYVAAFAHQQGSKMSSLPYGEDISPTLIRGQTMAVLIENHSQDCRWTEAKDNICPTLTSAMGTEGNNTPFVLENPPEINIKDFTPYAESGFVTYDESEVGTLRASGGHYGGGSETLLVSNDEKCITAATGDYTQINKDKTSTLLLRDYKSPPIVVKAKSIVRKLTPLECERLQGFPEVMEVHNSMTDDEYIAYNLACKNIIVDFETGDIYATRGEGGVILKTPKKLKGTILNGYHVYSIRNGKLKKQCRGHRIVWIAAHGIPADDFVVDHINNDKLDNRLTNLQLLTVAENSTKSAKDGLYITGEENSLNKIDSWTRTQICDEYANGDTTIRKLVEEYSISKNRVHQIVRCIGWTATESDSARYKALGNSVALPCVDYIMSGIADALYEN